MKSFTQKDVELIRRSELFNADWYLAQYPDVRALGMDPAEHYLWIGARINRHPSPHFDSKAYITCNPDVANVGINPLLHYIRWGAREGRLVLPAAPPTSDALVNDIIPENFIDYIQDKHLRIKRSYRIFDKQREKLFNKEIADLYKVSQSEYDEIQVSIVMPTYNRQNTIEESIVSVLNQTHRNWELIVVDDGSTDRTNEVVKKYQKDPRILYINIGRNGVSHARNQGLKRANGELVAYLDSDNTWVPEFLRTMVVFTISQRLDAAYCAIRAVNDNSEDKLFRGDIFSWPACLKANYIDMNSFIHKRNIEGKTIYFDTSLKRMVDWDYILRITKKSSISYAPFVGVTYYDGEKLQRITNSEYINGGLPDIVRTIREKHKEEDYHPTSIDNGAGFRLSMEFNKIPMQGGTLLFYPDYRSNNSYQKLLYEGFNDYDVAPGTIEDCLKIATQDKNVGRRLVFHLHWLNPLVSSAPNAQRAAYQVDDFLSKARLFKSLGGLIVWTVHNVISHEPKYAEEEVRLSKGVVDLADWIHVHHEAVSDATAALYEIPKEKVLVAEHGNYIGSLPNTMTKAGARRELGVPENAKVFVFLGQIRAYKGIEELIAAFSAIAQSHPDCWLLIAGKVLGLNITDIREKLDNVPNVIFRPGYVPDDEVQKYMRAADIAVLPYKNVLTSGSVFLAMSFDLPVICPRIGLLEHLIKDGENGYVFEGAVPNGLMNALRRCADTSLDELQIMGQRARSVAERHEWRSAAAKIRHRIETIKFGKPIRTDLPQSSRLWFVRGNIEEIKSRRCIAILLHYDGLEDTRRTVNSLLRQGNDVGVIVISNNDKLDDIIKISEEFDKCLFVQSDGNIGYAAANNFGLWVARQSDAEFFWIVNPDIFVGDEIYRELVKRVSQYPDHDFFGTALAFSHRPNIVAFGGGQVSLEKGGTPSHLYIGEPLSALPGEPFECDYLTGSNIFGRTRALPAIGYMPEEFFLYFEETDWFVQLDKTTNGRKPLLFPDIVVLNGKKSETDGLPSRYYIYYFCRNSLLFGRRHAPEKMRECEAEVKKFADIWLSKIAKRAPHRLAEFEKLVEKALADGRNGRCGKVPEV